MVERKRYEQNLFEHAVFTPEKKKKHIPLLLAPKPILLKINTLIAFPPLPPFRRKTVKDKANHAVVLDKATQDKLQKDVQSYRLITVATLVDRLKINGSLARQSLKDLEDKGQIKKVVGHSKLSIYSKCSLLFTFSCRKGLGGGRGGNIRGGKTRQRGTEGQRQWRKASCEHVMGVG